MSTTVRRTLLVLAVIGLAAALTSTWVHYRMLRQPGYLSFCDVNETVSCTQVYQSRFATVAGVPVAIGGALWFAFVLVLAAASARMTAERAANVAGYIFALATIALGVILYLAYAAFFILKLVCLMCLVTYAAVIGIFVISGARTAFPMTTLPRRLARDLRLALTSPVALLVAVIFIATAVSAVAFFPREATPQAAAAGAQNKDMRSEFERWFESQPRVEVPVPREGAAVLVVKFSDYQCPACRQTYFDYRTIFAKYAAEYPGKVKLVVKDFPLEPECNPNVPNGTHVAACEAAAAVRMAREKGRGEAMEEWLFTNQQSLTPDAVRTGARQIGQVTDYDAQYPAAVDQVKSDTALARLLGIRVTPTFFINGVKVEGGLPAEYFDQALQIELKRSGQAK